MKVLKYGEECFKIVTCDKCKSELEYSPRDVDIRTFYSSELVTYHRIQCPVCGHFIILYRNTSEYILPEPKPEPKPKKKWWQIFNQKEN